MFHISKKKWMGCGVAAAAMLADVSYDEAEAHWPDLDDVKLRWPRQLRALLNSLTETDWDLSRCWLPVRSVGKFPFPSWPVAVFIQDSLMYPRFGQWIVVKGEIVHDPGVAGACLMNRYSLRGWLVTWMAQPVRPAELTRLLPQTRLQKLRDALQPLLVANYQLPASSSAPSEPPG